MSITSFHGYEILEVLPAGGMSKVYKARQLSLDRIVAIKVLPSSMGLSTADVEKFMAEAKITASLKHRNIVQVYDFGKSEDGAYYFAMEYVSGYSVAAWIRRKKCLSEENSLLCGLSVAAAMNYAWQKAGIVHCDIKPDNVIIDDDGTVKLADLGLARSVQSVLGQAKPDDKLIFGTPNYISPEQSRGGVPLDCRADIYSLGAMLYHCMTGTMPFEGVPPLEVMDRQITDFIPDPQDVNPRISVWSACLIEKMMAKDPHFRQKDWNETIHDLTNARSEMMPQGSLPPDVASTVKRSAKRAIRLKEVDQAHEEKPVEVKKKLPVNLPWKLVLSAAAAGLLMVTGWSAFYFTMSHKSQSAPRPVRKQKVKEVQRPALKVQQPAPKVQQPTFVMNESASETSSIQTDSEREALKKYEEVVSWTKANPDNPDEAISRFQKLTEEAADTKYASMARNEIQKLKRLRGEIREVIIKLDEKANSLADQNRFLEAVAVYEKYNGPFEKVTSVERERSARPFLKKHAEYLEKQQQLQKLAESQLKHVVDEIAMILVEDDLNAALRRINELAADLPSVCARPEFKSLTATLEKSTGAEQKIINSFQLQKDQEVNISFLSGAQKLLIRDVQGELVIAEKITAIEQGRIGLQKNFKMRDLTLTEKISRIGSGEGPEFALIRVRLAIQDGDYNQAAVAAAGTGPCLSEALRGAIEQRVRDIGEERAAQAFAHILRRTRIDYKGNLPDPESCLNILRDKKRSFRKSETMARMIAQFRSMFGSTEFAKRYDVVLAVLANPDLEIRDNVVQALPPSRLEEEPSQVNSRPEEQSQPDQPKLEEQPHAAQQMIKSVTLKMMEQNSGLTENQIAFRADESGRITGADIVSMYLCDIQALENLTNLQKLVCAGIRQTKKVWLKIPPIAPLSDLKPVSKMYLHELIANHTRIKDISFLSRMPLTYLDLAHTRVNNLEPLSGMPLQYLDLSFCPVRDLRPLAGLPLTYLNLTGTEILNLAPLSGMPLKQLFVSLTKISDLRPLRSMPLQQLSLSRTEVTDLTPLREMPLETLLLNGTNVRDISPLAGMRLHRLDLSETRVSDLSVLEGIPLEILDIRKSAVRNISPLKNIPLVALDMRETGITDLTPIANSSIKSIWMDDFYVQMSKEKARTVLSILQGMPNLRKLNGKDISK